MSNERTATLATLQLKIDTSEVPAAIEALNRLAEAAERAHVAVTALGDVPVLVQRCGDVEEMRIGKRPPARAVGDVVTALLAFGALS